MNINYTTQINDTKSYCNCVDSSIHLSNCVNHHEYSIQSFLLYHRKLYEFNTYLLCKEFFLLYIYTLNNNHFHLLQQTNSLYYIHYPISKDMNEESYESTIGNNHYKTHYIIIKSTVYYKNTAAPSNEYVLLPMLFDAIKPFYSTTGLSMNQNENMNGKSDYDTKSIHYAIKIEFFYIPIYNNEEIIINTLFSDFYKNDKNLSIQKKQITDSSSLSYSSLSIVNSLYKEFDSISLLLFLIDQLQTIHRFDTITVYFIIFS